MNLHVFADGLGHYSSLITNKVMQLEGKKQNNLFVNLVNDLSQSKITGIENLPFISDDYEKFIQNLPGLKKIIFHPYESNMLPLLRLLHKRQPWLEFHWVHWSHDVYNVVEDISIYDNFSRKFINKAGQENGLKYLLKKLFYPIVSAFKVFRNNFYTNRHELIKSYESFSYFYSYSIADYHYLNNIYKAKNEMVYKFFMYNSIDFIFPVNKNYFSKGNVIMVGHNASLEGNHFEILETIKGIKSTNQTLLIPLTYGYVLYKKALKKNIFTMFPEGVEIIEDHLELEAYYEKLEMVGFAIFNFKIPLGMGNLIALLMMGIKVFISNKISSYSFFKELGLIVFSTELDLNSENLRHKLTQEQVETNRRILLARLSAKEIDKFWQPIVT